MIPSHTSRNNTNRNGGGGDGGEFEDWTAGNWCYVASKSSTGVAAAAAAATIHANANDNAPPEIKQVAVLKKEVTTGTSNSKHPSPQQPQKGVVVPRAIQSCGRDDEKTNAEDVVDATWEAGNWSWLPHQEEEEKEEEQQQQQQSRKNRKRRHSRTQTRDDGKLKEEEEEDADADADDGNTDQDNEIDGIGLDSSSSSPRPTTTTNANPDSTASSWWSSSFATRTAARTKRRKLTRQSSTIGTIEDDDATTVHTTTGGTIPPRKNEDCGPEHEDHKETSTWEPGNWCWLFAKTTDSADIPNSLNNQRRMELAAGSNCVVEEDNDSCGDTDDEPDDESTDTYDEYRPADTGDDDDDDDDVDPDVDPNADGDNVTTATVTPIKNHSAIWNAKWNEMFEKLVTYKNVHNSVNVRQDYKKDHLGWWVSTQRQFYRKKKLSTTRINRLESIGFDWNKLDGWNQMFERLVSYKRKFQSMNVPYLHSRLWNWTQTQRTNNKSNKLSQDRIDRLDSIGFVWNINDGNWMAKYHQLCAHRKKCKSTNFFHKYEPQLASWVSLQRFNKNKLSAKRLQLLDSIQFFDPLVENCDGEKWMAKYNRLCAYKKRFKSTNVPVRYKPDPQLGSWVYRQRWKKNKLSTQRVQLLDSIGFFDPLLVSTYDEKWLDMYRRLCAYKTKFKSTNVPYDYKPDQKLAAWVSTQRFKFKKNKLSKQRFQLLDSIRFFL